MSSLVSFLVFCQALGAFGGAFSAVWGELSYVRAIRDGMVDAAEQAHLNIIAKGLQFGISLLLVASLGLMVLSYIAHVTFQPAMTSSYWMFIVLALLIISIFWALLRRRIPFVLGSAATLAAWWLLVYLAIGKLHALPVSVAVSFFVVATALFYAILRSARFLTLPKT